MLNKFALQRRDFLRVAALSGAGASLAGVMPAWAQAVSPGLVPLPTVSGAEIALSIGRVAVRVDGKVSREIGINGTVPGPLIRLKEGQNVRLKVTNTLDEDSSIHWHGLLVPFAMDGVPGVSFPGIKPHSTFDYQFDVGQSGRFRSLATLSGPSQQAAERIARAVGAIFGIPGGLEEKRVSES